MQLYEEQSGPPEWWTGGPEEEPTAEQERGRPSGARGADGGRSGRARRTEGTGESSGPARRRAGRPAREPEPQEEYGGYEQGGRPEAVGGAAPYAWPREDDGSGAEDGSGEAGGAAGVDLAAAGLVRAADLAGGRRRRRSALEAEGLVEPGPAESPEPAAKPARTGGRRRAGAGGAESGGRWSPGAAGDADSESADGEESGGRRRKSGRRSGAAADGEPGGRRRRGAAVEEDVDPEVRARDICLRLLTGTAKTRKQLADALRRKEIPAEVIERVLDRYEEVGLIDDAAFAQAWVEQRHAGRRLGRRALAQELRTRGVEGELVEQAVAQVEPEDEEAAARDLVERKLRTTRGLDSQVRTRRLVGMLARRGYAEGLAFRVVRAALQAEGEDGEDDPLEW